MRPLLVLFACLALLPAADQLGGMPGWIMDPSDGGKSPLAAYGVCLDEGDLHTRVAKATATAQAEIARIIDTKAMVIAKLWSREGGPFTKPEDRRKALVKVPEAAKQVSKEFLVGMPITERYLAPDGQLYALIRLDEPTSAKLAYKLWDTCKDEVLGLFSDLEPKPGDREASADLQRLLLREFGVTPERFRAAEKAAQEHAFAELDRLIDSPSATASQPARKP